MAQVKSLFIQIGAMLIMAPLMFLLVNLILDGRMRITDFEAGALVGFVGLRLIEILMLVFRS